MKLSGAGGELPTEISFNGTIICKFAQNTFSLKWHRYFVRQKVVLLPRKPSALSEL